MIAEGGTEYGHMETIARSRQPYGPFESCPHNPVLTNRSMDSSIQATGHADLIEAQDGSWWAVCLGIRPVAYPKAHHLGREVYLAPVTWTEEGWPVIGRDTHIDPQMDAPELPQTPWPASPVRDDFNEKRLGFDWTFLRNPLEDSWSLEERPGYLVLHGHETNLSNAGAPAFVGRRLSHFSCSIAAAMEYEPQHEGEEAGLTVFMNEKHHYDIAVTLVEGRKKVVFRKTIGSLQTEQTWDCPEGSVELKVQAYPKKIVASLQTAQGSTLDLGWGETHLLSTEVAGGFTGVFIAMYAAGSAEGHAAPAAFDWFDYEPQVEL